MSKLLLFLSKLSGSLQVYYKGHSAATLIVSMAVLKCHKTIRCAANYAEAEDRERKMVISYKLTPRATGSGGSGFGAQREI